MADIQCPYNESLIPAKLIQRHLFWSNFYIEDRVFGKENLREVQIPDLQELHGFDLSKYNLKDKRQVLRNCVLSELGLHVFNSAFGQMQMPLLASFETKETKGE